MRLEGSTARKLCISSPSSGCVALLTISGTQDQAADYRQTHNDTRHRHFGEYLFANPSLAEQAMQRL